MVTYPIFACRHVGGSLCSVSGPVAELCMPCVSCANMSCSGFGALALLVTPTHHSSMRQKDLKLLIANWSKFCASAEAAAASVSTPGVTPAAAASAVKTYQLCSSSSQLLKLPAPTAADLPKVALELVDKLKVRGTVNVKQLAHPTNCSISSHSLQGAVMQHEPRNCTAASRSKTSMP